MLSNKIFHDQNIAIRFNCIFNIKQIICKSIMWGAALTVECSGGGHAVGEGGEDRDQTIIKEGKGVFTSFKLTFMLLGRELKELKN